MPIAATLLRCDKFSDEWRFRKTT